MPAKFFARPLAAAGLIGLLAAIPFGASAQQVYRIVGPDGRVTFSDRPPAEGQGRTSLAPTVTMQSTGSEGAGAALPFELRNVANRYPVTLYSRPGCAPCDGGRSFLVSRGIPFSERTVTSLEDIEALQRLAGTPTLPFVTIGGQQLKGYSQVEWGQFLDAAGYPKTSLLPSTYRGPAPTPLVAAATAVPPAPPGQQAEDSRQLSPVPVQAAPAPVNPAGIQF